ncbi:MAG: hypothetical protein ACFE8U_09400, partial [Candidatus Hermodarchaeota archaeon]
NISENNMNCQLIYLIFNKKDPSFFSLELEAQFEAILELGRVRGITIDFLSEICTHTTRTSQIFWQEMPIVKIRCLGTQSDFEVFNNNQDILFYLIQPLIRYSQLQFISLLVDFRLPSWTNVHEFLFVLNRSGNIILFPMKSFSSKDLTKLRRVCKIQAEKNIEKKQDLDLLDAIAPNPFSNSDFRIFIQ